MAVIAEKKTRESIWEGLRMGRTYAVTGDKILCDFRINDAYQEVLLALWYESFTLMCRHRHRLIRL